MLQRREKVPLVVMVVKLWSMFQTAYAVMRVLLLATSEGNAIIYPIVGMEPSMKHILNQLLLGYIDVTPQ